MSKNIKLWCMVAIVASPTLCFAAQMPNGQPGAPRVLARGETFEEAVGQLLAQGVVPEEHHVYVVYRNDTQELQLLTTPEQVLGLPEVRAVHVGTLQNLLEDNERLMQACNELSNQEEEVSENHADNVRREVLDRARGRQEVREAGVQSLTALIAAEEARLGRELTYQETDAIIQEKLQKAHEKTEEALCQAQSVKIGVVGGSSYRWNSLLRKC